MYTILVSIDEGLERILQMQAINLGIILQLALLRESKLEIRYSHAEDKKNIRLLINKGYYSELNFICKQNDSYVNEYAGELILEVFLDIIKHAQNN